MPSVSRSFSVQPSPAPVLEYLADFSRAEEWDPGTVRCTRIDDGPVAVGASWHNTSKLFGVTTQLTYVLSERTAERVVFVGRNKSATSTDTITVQADGSGSRVTYRADLSMHGWWVVTSPLMRLVFEKLAGDTERQLSAVLNRLPPDRR